MQLIPLIKLEVLIIPAKPRHPRRQGFLPRPRAALVPIGLEMLHVHPDGHARRAMITVRTISEEAAATKSLLHQFTIEWGVDEVGGSGHLGTSVAVGKIAARVFCGRVKLQNARGEILWVAHACSSLRTAAVPPMGCSRPSWSKRPACQRGAGRCKASSRSSRKAGRLIGDAPRLARCPVSC